MNGLEALLLAFAGLVGLVTAVGWYLLRKLKRLESEQEERAVTDRATALRKAEAAEQKATALQEEIDILKPLADKVPGLEKTVGVLSIQLEALQKRMAESEQREADKNAENDKLSRENRALERQNTDLIEANKRLCYENGAYKNALALIGMERAERESLEEKAPIEEPEASETTEEQPKEE
jgi:regulator of replication initiation timing